MREIKFRGKRKDNGEWVYGSLVIQNGIHFIYVDMIDKGIPNYFQVLPETVGQYTGLNDKNGNKIFEGDVVKDIYDSIFAITFGTFTDTKGHDQVGFYKTYFSIDEDLNVCDGTLDDVDKTCEIIGNIHEKE